MNPLDASFLGLPLHPLVVHLVVVALPVGALATVASVVSPAVRSRFGLLSLGTLTLGALAAIAAKFSGEALAEMGENLVVELMRQGSVGLLVEQGGDVPPPGAIGLRHGTS